MATQPRSISRTIAAVTGLTATQQQVLHTLAQSPRPLRVDDLCEELQLHGNTIRGVLNTLLDQGLVGRQAEETEKRGRPSWLYEARASADAQAVMEGFSSLMGALSQQLADSSPDPEAAALELGARWGERILEEQDVPDHSGFDKSSAVADLPIHLAKMRIFLSRLGFQATGSGRSDTIELHQCPLLDPDSGKNSMLVCEIHRGMLNQVVTETSGGTLSADVVPAAGPGFCTVILNDANQATTGIDDSAETE